MDLLCQNCGKPIAPNDNFCSFCGSSVSQQPIEQPPFQQQNYVNAQYQQSPHSQYPHQQSVYTSPQYHQSVYASPYQQPPHPQFGTPYMNPHIDPALFNCSSKEEYRKICKNKKFLQSINAAAIFAYVSSGITFLLSILLDNLIPLIDIAIVLPLAIILQTKKTKGCAIGLMIYAIISFLTNIVMYESFSGSIWLITAISAVRAFSIADKEYEAMKFYR